MDSGGKPDGNDISGEGSLTINGVHHDPLNENLEETWSALGEQDEPSAADSDPGMLPPPIPVLPTALGSIIGQPIHHRGMSELSVIQAPNRTITAANINQRGSEGIIIESMAGKQKHKQAEEIPKAKIAPAGIFGRKAPEIEELEAESNTTQKRKPSKSSQQDTETLKSQSSKGTGSSIQKEEDVQLDMFYQTMYTATKKLSLIKQIELRREIRQLVMNAEKQEQAANREKSSLGPPPPETTTQKKRRFSAPKW